MTYVPYPHAHQVPPEGHEGEKACLIVRLAAMVFSEEAQDAAVEAPVSEEDLECATVRTKDE